MKSGSGSKRGARQSVELGAVTFASEAGAGDLCLDLFVRTLLRLEDGAKQSQGSEPEPV